jgi:RNA polymerase sigma-70 factor (ECF subfamily)
MPNGREWQLERYLPLLRVQLRQMQLDPRLRRRLDASDLVQEVLLRAHQNLSGFRGSTEAELVKWLDQIMANVAVDAVRREHAQKRDIDLEQGLQDALAQSSARLERFLSAEQTSPSEQAIRHEEFLRLAERLDRLPAEERDVLIQRHLVGASVQQIAAELGRTEKGVAGLLYRAQRRLRQLLAEDH